MVTLGSNTSFSQALRSLNKTSRSIQSLSQKLATGRKVNTGSDNPALLQQIAQLTSQASGFQAVNFNVGTASSALNTAEGGLSSLTSTVGQLRDLAVQASNDFLSPAARSAINDQADSLLGSLNDIAGNINFNGQNLLDGSFGSKSIQVGPNGGDTLSIALSSANATALGVDGIDLGNSASAGSAITTLDAALTQLQSQRSAVGSTLQRLDSIYQTNQTSLQNTTAALSTAQDLDIGNAVSNLSKLQVQQKAQLLTLSASLSVERSKLSLLV